MPPPFPLLSLATLVDTARLRHTLNLCLFASSLFLFLGLGARQGWAEGIVRTDATYTLTSNEAVPCPSAPDLSSNTTDCFSSQSIIASVETQFTYGLFRDLVYRSVGTQEVTTSIYAHSDSGSNSNSSSNSSRSGRVGGNHKSSSSSIPSSSSPPTLIRTDITIDPPIENTLTQPSYSLWAQGNTGTHAKSFCFIRAAQSFLLLATTALMTAWVLLFKGLRAPPPNPPPPPPPPPPPQRPTFPHLFQQQTQQQQYNQNINSKAFANLKLGEYLVFFSALCVFLSLFSYTGGVSPHALTHICTPAADAATLPALPPLPPSNVTAAASVTALSSSPEISCTQLQSDPCRFLLLSLPPSLQSSAQCFSSTTPASAHGRDINTHAGMWSLVFFTFLLLLFTGKVWREVIGIVEGATAAEEEGRLDSPLLGGQEE